MNTSGLAFVKPKDQKPRRTSKPHQMHSPEYKRFREAVWARDGGKDRLTGQPLSRTDPCFDRLGDVCHLKARGPHRELALDPNNAILLSRTHHILSDSRGGRRLHIIGDDASKPLLFRMHDAKGNVLWQVER